MGCNRSQKRMLCNMYPPKNGVIALWPNMRVVKCKYYVSRKQNGFNNKMYWYSILLNFLSKFTARLKWRSEEHTSELQSR